MKNLALFTVTLLITAATALPAQAADKEVQDTVNYVERATAQIDDYLRHLEKARNAGVWTYGFTEIMRLHPWVDFRWIEGRLRQVGSDAYLIAAPIANVSQDYCARTLFGIPEGDMPFYLWVSVNGREEAVAQMAEFKIESDGVNLQNLQRTGLLTLKPRLQ